jgi:GT2 family glycosyltransferase
MKRSVDKFDNVSIVLVNYKTLDMTRTCLDLLREGLQGTGARVYVVDNDSADASVEYLRTLDWIHLIERKSPGKESGSTAHGLALDCALEQIDTDYAFLLHSDTMVHDTRVFSMMLEQCAGRPGVAAVGCLEQLNRGRARTAWRVSKRFVHHYVRRALKAVGMKARPPKPYIEQHLKSFCALWNVRLIKERGLHFHVDESNPGYALQDTLQDMGYSVRFLAPRIMFQYLEHLQSGTVAAIGGYLNNHRRVQAYQRFAGRLHM